ncbi:MAG: ATP-binding protein [Bacteroidales bacterium]|nr:ATP-binding protein [Bacteroidales bacterium]
MMKKLPIGIQSFEKLRVEDYLYVDKTRLVYDLAHSGGSYFFLSRPRRFGKSLLLSTLKAYFEGKRHLFEGLGVMELEHDWKQYPVLHLLALKSGDPEEFLHQMQGFTAERGAREIEARDYALPFATDPRKLYRVAVSFNTEKRNIDEWQINSDQDDSKQ